MAVNPGRTDTAMQQELRELGQGAMTEANHQSFVDDFREGRLNKPEAPGTRK